MSPRPLDRTYRHWPTGWIGDQGAKPYCVGYSFVHWMEASPVRHPARGPAKDPVTAYAGAQDNDEWPGSDYDGSSVRGAFKWARSQGIVSAYHWALSIEDVIEYLIHDGPMVFGTDWTDRMFTVPRGDVLDCSGQVVGGHAYLCNGINLRRGLLRLVNSWGADWAGDGRVWMEIEDADRLIFRQYGEACAGVEVRP
jgi:hypothetical protein